MIDKLVSLIPKGGRPYCEPYTGSLEVFFARQQAPVEAINDMDHRIINLYRVLQNAQALERFMKMLDGTTYSRADFKRAAEILRGSPVEQGIKEAIFYHKYTIVPAPLEIPAPLPQVVDVEKAWAFFVLCNQRVPPCALANRLETLRERLKCVMVDCIDAFTFIRYWDSPNSVMYVDPPCIEGEANIDYHGELVDLLLTLKGAVVISHYSHPIYEKLTRSGWEKHELRFDFSVECAWRNPKAVSCVNNENNLLI